MGRLEFAPILPSPADYERRFNQVNHLLDGEGLSLQDLEEKGSVLLGPGIRVKDWVGLLAGFDRLRLAVASNGEEVLRTSRGRDRLAGQIPEEGKTGSEVTQLLEKRKLISLKLLHSFC